MMSSDTFDNAGPMDPIGGLVGGRSGSHHHSYQTRPLGAVVDTIGSEISGLPVYDIFPFLTRCLTQKTPLSFASVWVMDAQDGTLNCAS